MIERLSPDEERAVRAKVSSYLAAKPSADETALAVDGLRYLRKIKEEQN